MDIDFSRDEKEIASAGWDHTIKIWDIETGQLKKSIVGHEGPVNAVNFTADGKSCFLQDMMERLDYGIS